MVTVARVGFVTSEELRTLTPDDRSVMPVLATRGIEVLPVVWTEPLPDRLDGLVLRSTWDYHLKLAEFLGWLDEVQASGLPLWNLPETVRGNVDKRYLLEVEARGVPIVPTRHVPRASAVALSALQREAGWSGVVVKPSISGGAFETWRAGPDGEGDSRFARQLERMDCLVQPFIPELVTAGEWSLVFLRGRYSHSVLKRPEPEDFRVQEEFGGMASAAEPPPEVIEAGSRALEATGQQTLYARVDGVIRNRRFELMELELVEPSLFLQTSPGAAERFSAAVAETFG